MRILYLAHRVPYPPNKGDKIRSYHHVRHLAQRHEVHLLSFADDPEDEAAADVLRRYCANVVVVRLHKPLALLRGASAMARGWSLSEGYFGARSMYAAVARAAATTRFDVGWAFSSVMAQYLPAVGATCRIADYVDVDSEKWRQYAERSRGPMRWAYAREAERLRAFECRAGADVTRVLFVSTPEARLFETFAPPEVAVRVLPNGVDTEYFHARPGAEEPRDPILLFTGALDYRPNVEAVLFCAREVLPLVRRVVPDARLLAVGHRPAVELQRAAEAQPELLSIAGSVPDVRPYFRQARVYVAPLQLGRGVQNKILEAMAMRVPVVASPLAVAGLDIEGGLHALVHARPDELAGAVISLLGDERRCRQLVDAAARLVEERYTWTENLKLLDACLVDAGCVSDAGHGAPQPHPIQAQRAALH